MVGSSSVCVHASAPDPPYSFSGRSNAQAGSQPISSSLCGQKSPVSVGLPRDWAAVGRAVIWGAGPLVRKIPGQRGELAGGLSCLSASLPPSPAPLCLPPLGALLVLLRGPCHTGLLAVPGPRTLASAPGSLTSCSFLTCHLLVRLPLSPTQSSSSYFSPGSSWVLSACATKMQVP